MQSNLESTTIHDTEDGEELSNQQLTRELNPIDTSIIDIK